MNAPQSEDSSTDARLVREVTPQRDGPGGSGDCRAFLEGYNEQIRIRLDLGDLSDISSGLSKIIKGETNHYFQRESNPFRILEGMWYSRLKAHAPLQLGGFVSPLNHGGEPSDMTNVEGPYSAD